MGARNMSGWSRMANLSFSCTASKWDTITVRSAIPMTGHTETVYCCGSRWKTLTRLCSAPLKWAWRSSCRVTEILLMVTAVRITGSAGYGIRRAMWWWLPVRTGRPAEHGAPGSRITILRNGLRFLSCGTRLLLPLTSGRRSTFTGDLFRSGVPVPVRPLLWPLAFHRRSAKAGVHSWLLPNPGCQKGNTASSRR